VPFLRWIDQKHRKTYQEKDLRHQSSLEKTF
jgi:hypothetical protein